MACLSTDDIAAVAAKAATGTDKQDIALEIAKNNQDCLKTEAEKTLTAEWEKQGLSGDEVKAKLAALWDSNSAAIKEAAIKEAANAI